MNARNQARERRRALARRNALANEIASACANGITPHPRLVADWERAYFAAKALTRKEAANE